jgi:two-component system nitrogen regulation sensor histidine kinase NtrY
MSLISYMTIAPRNRAISPRMRELGRKMSPEPLKKMPTAFSAELAEQRRRRRERHLMVAATLFLICTTALTVYLSGPTTFVSLASNILVFGLLFLNAILILLLLFLVVRNLVKLLFERKRGIFGAKLRTKFVVAFVGFSVIPAVLLFVVAILYIGKSTELWLSSQIEQSLAMSKDIVDAFCREKGTESLTFARQTGRFLVERDLLSDNGSANLQTSLESKRREFQLDFLAVYSTQLDPLADAFSSGIPWEAKVSMRDTALLNHVLRGEERSGILKFPTGEAIAGCVPLYSGYDPKDMIGVVAAGYLVPQTLGTQMEAVSMTYEEYRQLRSQQRPIQLNYYILLTIVLLLVIFLSSWFGFYLAKQITIPVQALAEKTQEVASGRLDFHLDEISRDEIGVLVESFNRMTQRLRSSQHALEASHRELERATLQADQRRRYMEIVLRNVAAGVISLDEEDRITTVNRAAEEMLGIKAEGVLQRKYMDVIKEEHRPTVQALLEELESAPKESIQRELHLNLDGRSLSLGAHVTVLRDEECNYMGMVVVFDDLTELQKAHRMLAWKEVARRIAHEIKNPLTPIKLSAQRLRRRYLRDPQNHEGVLDESTSTIIEQVDHLQTLVNEFQRFARMPSARPTPQDLNRIVEDVVVLYRGGHPTVAILSELDEDLPTLTLDRDQIQRVLINLIDNALAVIPEGDGKIQIRTSFNKRLRVARLEVADNGPGILAKDRGKLFEPYFSTKKSGTGLGLTIVRSIVMDHRGYIRVMDNDPKGTRFMIELPL